jgi:DNA-binding winged helix-turn-helix (wHTH) protein/tetratricopeptide (TPR) repeat protein
MTVQDGHIYEFADFRLISGEGLLLRNGQPVPLTPKAFSTLVLLVERHGHLVQKDELIEEVWNNAFVEEAAVSRCIWTVRQALGDDSKDPVFIHTVPKRGYKFIANVSVAERLSDDPKAPAAVATIGDPPFRSRQRYIIQGAISLSVLLLLAGYFVFFGPSTHDSEKRIRIAVLPLKPVNAETHDRLYELAIADALILKISASKNVEVRRLQAVRDYAETDRDAVEAGKEQQVDLVLASNYQISNGRIRVTSQLLNIPAGQVEDTFVIEKDAVDFFTAQQAVANDLGNKLLARVGASQTDLQTKRGTSNEEAYRLYLDALYLSTQRRADSLTRSLELFEKVVELDPNYAQAWASKAHAHLLSAMTTSNVEPGQAYSRSMEAINKAFSLDPDLSDAYSALCQAKTIYEYDLAGAEPVCKRALELDPGSSRAHQIYAFFMDARGRPEESVAEMKIALSLDPMSYANHRFYANSLYFARQYGDAFEQYQRLIDLDPNAYATYNWLIRTLEAQGKESEAFDWLIRSVRAQKDSDEAVRRYTTAYQTSGWQGVLQERIRNADGGRSTNSFRIAGWYAVLGNKDKAFEYLDKAFGGRDGLMPFLEVEPQFDPLRDDPRYIDLVRRIHGISSAG